MVYPTWSEILERLPAKWRSPLVGSTARIVRIRKDGFLIDINDFNVEKMESAMCTDGFRSALLKELIPWAWNHPAGKPRRCWGICLGGDITEGTKELRALGATFHFVQPRRYSCPASTT